MTSAAGPTTHCTGARDSVLLKLVREIAACMLFARGQVNSIVGASHLA